MSAQFGTRNVNKDFQKKNNDFIFNPTFQTEQKRIPQTNVIYEFACHWDYITNKFNHIHWLCSYCIIAQVNVPFI